MLSGESGRQLPRQCRGQCRGQCQRWSAASLIPVNGSLRTLPKLYRGSTVHHRKLAAQFGTCEDIALLATASPLALRRTSRTGSSMLDSLREFGTAFVHFVTPWSLFT